MLPAACAPQPSAGNSSLPASLPLPTQEADLVVVEFSFNEAAHEAYGGPTRRGFEQLLRKLLRLPHAPAVIVLHHYAWHYAEGDGVPAGLFYRQPEEHLGTLAQVGGGWGQRQGCDRRCSSDRRRPPLSHLPCLPSHVPPAPAPACKQYYDLPSPSLRNALYHDMRADVAPFRTSRVAKPGQTNLAGAPLPAAEPGAEGDCLYADGIHPSGERGRG